MRKLKVEINGKDSLSIEHKEVIHIFHKAMNLLIRTILCNNNNNNHQTEMYLPELRLEPGSFYALIYIVYKITEGYKDFGSDPLSLRNSGFGSSEIIKFAIFNIVAVVQVAMRGRIAGGEDAKIEDFPYQVSEFLPIIDTYVIIVIISALTYSWPVY